MKVEKELRKKAPEGGSQQHSAFKNETSKGSEKIHVDDAEGLILLTLLM